MEILLEFNLFLLKFGGGMSWKYCLLFIMFLKYLILSYEYNGVLKGFFWIVFNIIVNFICWEVEYLGINVFG